MATKLYLLSAANPLTGTFPTSEQSSQTASWSMTGASTLLSMRGTKGSAQGSFSGASLASTAAQRAFCGYFASDTLDVDQNVGGAGQTLTLNIANRETSLSMNFGSDLRCNVYIWRPSTGEKVGTICDCVVMTGDAEPSGSALTKVNNATTTATSTVSALAGDVIICEIWQFHTQGAATSYTGSVYANGTTETATTNTTVTNHASFLNFSADTLTFGTPAGGSISATAAITLASDSASGSADVIIEGDLNSVGQNDSTSALADVDVSAQLSATGQNDSASSAADVDVSASLSTSLQNDTLSSSAGLVAADISATLAATLQGDGLSAQSLASVAATASLVNAGDSAAAQSKAGVSASSALTMQADSASSIFVAQVSASSAMQLASDQASSSALILIGAGLSTTLIGDTSASFGTVFISAESANQDLDDYASSEISAEISAESETEVAADIMTASVSVGGELTPSIERTLYIGAQSRNNVIEIQRRTSVQVAQSRSVAFESQNRHQSLIAQNRSAAPEPQNRNIAE